MAIRINTNTVAQTSVRALNHNNRALGNTFERISSGLRINRAADDAAGLAMAEKFDSERRSGLQALRNANDGVSAIQIAESATNEVGEILKRMRELAVQGASDLITTTERAFLTTEYTQLSGEVDRIAGITEFNGLNLVDGSTPSITVQVGTGSAAINTIDITTEDIDATALGINALDYSTAADSRTAIATIDTAMGTLNTVRSNFGAVQNRLTSAMNNMEQYTTNLGAAESRIRDADFAHETAEMSKLNILQQAGMAVLGQANNMNQGAIRLLG